MKKLPIIIFAVFTCSTTAIAQTATETEAEYAQVQEPLQLPPLFEYPVASEDMPWQERSNWLTTHFWDNFDFKSKAVGQSQLNHAFRTYIVPLHLADRDVALSSVDELIKKLQKNPTLILQFTQAAERNIYDTQTAELIIDEVYLKFLNALCKQKKIPELRKARYKAQLSSLQNSVKGSSMPSFGYTDRNGNETSYSFSGRPAIIEFGDYDCTDCRITRLRLETDSELQQLIDSGKAEILFISPDVDPDQADEWSKGVAEYPLSWTVGRAEGLDDIIDLRKVPCLYLIDNEGKIYNKGVDTDTARRFLKNMCQE